MHTRIYHIVLLLPLFLAALARGPEAASAQILQLTPYAVVLDTIEECETTEFILTLRNVSSGAVSLDSVVCGGTDGAEFSLRSPLPLFLAAGDSIRLILRLSPVSTGDKSATVTVLGSTPDFIRSNAVDIAGHVVKAALAYTPIGINFGPIYVAQKRQQTITIVNTGAKDILISRLSVSGDTGVFHVLNNQAPLTLPPGGSYVVTIEFAPATEGDFRAFLQVNSNDCKGLVTVISLDGSGAKSTIAEVGLPDEVRGKPGSIIGIPILLKNRIPDFPASGFSFFLTYNPTTLIPRDVNFLTTGRVGYTADWSVLRPGLLRIDARGASQLSEPGPMARVIVEVFIGDSESFPLGLESFEFKDNRPFSIATSGIFRLDSICAIPQQLVIQKSVARLLRNHPNPFNPSTTIEYEISRESEVRLRILDPFGREVALLADELQSPGAYRRSFAAERLASGMYYCMLEIPGERHVLKMLLLR